MASPPCLRLRLLLSLLVTLAYVVVDADARALRLHRVARVARGQTVTARELAKSMAYVVHGGRNLCSATVVSSKWLLLAGHCGARVGDKVRVGRYKWAAGTRHSVVAVQRHPNYTATRYGYDSDLALVRIAPPAYNARPIRLNTHAWVPSAEATVYGFGYGLGVGNPAAAAARPFVLRKGRFVALAPWKCRWRFRASGLRSVAAGVKRDIHLCANERVVGRGMCAGDSGGPLVMKTAGGLLQVGVNSYRVAGKCGLTSRPDVYARVSRYNSWIESIAGTSPGFIQAR